MRSTAKSISLLAVLLVLMIPAAANDLFNNTNTLGTLNHAPNSAFFQLIAPAHITELATYHWNNGRGAVPGTISLRHQSGQIFGPFQTHGSNGQWGAPNVNWVADVNITIPPGAYIVLDSDPNTWSHNPQSGYRGFAIVRGSYLPPTPQPRSNPQPAPAPMPMPVASTGFHACAPSTYSVAFTGPCNVAAGAPVTIEMRRSLTSPPAMLLFKRVLSPGIISQVSSGISGNGTFLTASLPVQVCVGGTGSVWNIYRIDSSLKSWGEIGQVTIDCRAYHR